MSVCVHTRIEGTEARLCTMMASGTSRQSELAVVWNHLRRSFSRKQQSFFCLFSGIQHIIKSRAQTCQETSYPCNLSETDDVINAHQWWSEASLLLLFDTFTVPAAQACRCRTVVLLWSISSESTQIVTLKTASCQN